MFHVIINPLFMVLSVPKKSANFAAQKVDVSMKLSELKAGERGVIVRVSGHGGFRKRIVELGFVRGKTVRAIMSAPLADPVEYEVMDYKVSLRRAEAALVEVVSEEEVRRAEQDTSVEDLSPIPYTEEEIGQERQRLQQRMEQLAEERHRSITVALGQSQLRKDQHFQPGQRGARTYGQLQRCDR
jgi:Fe2+ transport system protein FeoA